MKISKREIVRCRIPSHEYREERYESWRTPNSHQHDAQFPVGHDERIVQRLDDSVVTVHRNAAQVKDGDGRKIDVHSVPDVAHEITE